MENKDSGKQNNMLDKTPLRKVSASTESGEARPRPRTKRTQDAAPRRRRSSASEEERSTSRRRSTGRTRSSALSEREKQLRAAQRKARKRRVLRQRLIVAGAILAGIILWYCVTANSYRSRFLPHTFINGFDVGSKSVADAEDLLRKSVENYTLELAFRGGGIEDLTSKDVDLTYVSSNEVEKILAGQNRAAWIGSFFGARSSYAVSTSFKFDTDMMRSYLESLPEFQEANITKPRNAHIVRLSNNSFRVATEVEGNEPNENAIFAEVDRAINASEARVNLAAVEGAYVEPALRQDDEDLNYTVERFNSFLDTTITIKRKDGSVLTYGRDDFVEWVTYDEESGTWSLSKETVYTKCYNIMQAIAEEDNDAHTTVAYDSTAVGPVVLPCASYGYIVDVESETDIMNEALLNRESREIEIENSVKESIDPKNGGTYIEVDVTNQHVTYYKDYKVFFETDCVTGKESNPERRTPSGVYSVLNKLENQILGSLTATDPGQRYESHVDYWMPFFESYGMHDASWRENFGGSWYLEYGSHGCVNLPPEDAGELFQDVDYYTPVIVVRAGDNAPDGTRRGDTTWNPPDGGLHYSESDD